MEKKKRDLLKTYIPLVDFIAGIVGPFCEVVLHDVSNVESSIVAIKNNHISGRQVGGPLTDLGLKLLKEKAYVEKDYLLNYPGKTKDGKVLRSSTFFIKDEDGDIAGMLCVNMDLSAAYAAKRFIEDFIMNINGEPQDQSTYKEDRKEVPENLTLSLEELMRSIIENTVAEVNVPPERMSPEEKMGVVHKLSEKGVFLLKGAIAEVARHLKTSENTIYRYLSRKNSDL
ncbi:helix-turn-helix transcriptional regulator [Thermosediminibacter oceani]|uniref:YheO domain protein n=1 Tax=Thermosediminibacter oceani (strain ATCC BAA-1034 / DSM 16646 / JW/IW-1228P) TaxID=555079 RepID=D9RYW2_THEOJ|nr:PAS domain-containing protein [Thermosediminibacter oceani]ADL08536.1 YheO domain protein [Thermosediminibacter oceani DSM 16646]